MCSSLRQLISSAARSVGGSKSNHGTRHFAVTKAITRLNVSYFFDVLESLNKDKRRVIESYGFGSLLLSDKCQIPIPFARWLVDRVNIDSWDIVLKKKSIPITP